jgi:tight adherence protein B
MDILNIKAGPIYILGLTGAFAGVALLISGVYQLIVKPVLQRRQVDRRLTKGRNQRLAQIQILKNVQEMEGSAFQAITKSLGAYGKIETLQRSLLQADIYWLPTTFLSVAGLLSAVAFLAVFFKFGIYPALGAAVVFGYAPFLVVRLKKSKKTRVIESQMPEAMELLARSLRAGHALPSSIELAGQETPQPLGGELKIVYEEQRLGLGMIAALKRMGDRVASQDLQYFVTAVMLQAETGGNLAEVMENIGYLIRERLKLKGKIQALTAEGRFSAIILAGLPFVIFGAMSIISRKYVDTLFREPSGPMLIGFGIVSIIVGILWMRKIVNIQV